jgi:D-amino peptidase
MKYLIAVDCEGPAGVVGAPGGTLTEATEQYRFACRQATAEASACARGLFAAGAEQVVVYDAHGRGVNLDYEALDERCDIFLGCNVARRLPMLDASYAGLFFIGYHARDNTAHAPLAHSYSSSTYQWIKLNGREVGELAIDAAVAGQRGVPPLLVVSDDRAVAEAGELFPGITTVQTKIGYGWNAALSKHPRRVLPEIEAAARSAAEGRAGRAPFTLPGPLEVEIRYKRIDDADAAVRPGLGWARVDAYTVRRTLATIDELF